MDVLRYERCWLCDEAVTPDATGLFTCHSCGEEWREPDQSYYDQWRDRVMEPKRPALPVARFDEDPSEASVLDAQTHAAEMCHDDEC
jgi:hypothetical protein